MKVLEIKKDDLKYNLNQIRKIIELERNNLQIYAVLKANGMGLDLLQYANFLVENGIKTLAVANTYEALTLRNNGIKCTILMLSPIANKEELEELIKNDITLTIGNENEYILIDEIAKKYQKIIDCHIKIDCGFGRYGFLYTEKNLLVELYKNQKNNFNVNFVGIFTHFPKALDEKKTRKQFLYFKQVIDYLENEKFNVGIKHVCASTSFLKYKDMWLDAVRLGSCIQGRVLIDKDKFKKVGTFKTKIEEIKLLPKGYFVSYGSVYKTKNTTKVAIIPVGYEDGFNKVKARDDFSLKNNIISVGMEIKKIFKDNSLKVKIKGDYYKVIGRLGMYYAIIDITDSNNIKVGDEVIINITPLQANLEIRREFI